VYPGAIAAADRALEINRHPAILDTQAWLYALSGEYDRALAVIDEAISIDPDNSGYEETRTRIAEMRKS
jgi:tetratricopeptide (TPR) repeat protein